MSEDEIIKPNLTATASVIHLQIRRAEDALAVIDGQLGRFETMESILSAEKDKLIAVREQAIYLVREVSFFLDQIVAPYLPSGTQLQVSNSLPTQHRPNRTSETIQNQRLASGPGRVSTSSSTRIRRAKKPV